MESHPEAAWYQKLDAGKVRCVLCPHHCLLTEGKRGICLTRQNVGGRLLSLNYCRPVSVAIDPIEKKPLYHFHPGSNIFSTGPNGCTFKCVFCQNCDISQDILATRSMNAADIAMRVRESGTVGIAYTYSEPFIWFETIMEVGRMVREQGQVNVMVTNGYMEPGPLAELLGVVDAMNIDIKSMDPAFYRRLCKGRLTPVLRACEQARKSCHLEITNLLIPGKNDSPAEVRELAAFVAANLGADTPLHLSRYFPRHRMDLPPTPQASLLQAYEIAREKLQYVYIGNSEAGDKANTYCPSCRALLVRRRGYQTQVTPGLAAAEGSKYAKCGKCGRETGIVVA